MEATEARIPVWKDLQPHIPWALEFARRLHTKHLLALNNPAFEPEDIVSQILHDVVTGARKWPETVSIRKGLTMCLINLCWTLGHRHRRSSLTHHHHQIPFAEEKYAPDTLEGSLFVEELRRLFSNDTELLQMIDCYIQAPGMKPRDLSTALEMPVEQIYNARKRLKRTVEFNRKRLNKTLT